MMYTVVMASMVILWLLLTGENMWTNKSWRYAAVIHILKAEMLSVDDQGMIPWVHQTSELPVYSETAQALLAQTSTV